MVQLRQTHSGTKVQLATRCLIGRSPVCHLVLSDLSVSREHAVVFFDGDTWHVRDLSSRNGTTVDGKRVHDIAVLRPSSVVRFGTEGSAWEVLDAAAPRVYATSEAGELVTGSESGLFLPSAAACEAFVSNQDGQWVVEQGGTVREVQAHSQLHLPSGLWTLSLTLGDQRAVEATAVSLSHQTLLSFTVSPDEEHVALSITHNGGTQALAHRSHNYLLLLLARARLSDQRTGQLQPSEHGWLETRELADMLKTNSEQINVWIFRARTQLHKLDTSLADRLIERRPTLGQLRIGIGGLSVSPH